MWALTMAINCVMFLLGQMIVLTVAEDNRAVLETTIITEMNEVLSMRWVETERTLANEHLPIWTTTSLRYHVVPDINVMAEVGPFKTFYDLEKSSAIILAEKWNCIFGVIKVRYTIVCLPLELLGQQHKIGESQYILVQDSQDFPNQIDILDTSKSSTTSHVANTRHDSSDQFRMLIKTFVNSADRPGHGKPRCEIAGHDRTMERPSTSWQSPPPSKRPRMDVEYKEEVITVYPEILIFISHEIVNTTNLMSTVIIRYLVQMNAVAMLFAQLATHNIKININIAGIIIDKNGHGFPPADLFMDNRQPEGKVVLDSLRDYIQSASDMVDSRRIQWPEDSLDMFLYSTTLKWKEREANHGGLSTDAFNIRAHRMTRHRGNKVKKLYLGSMVDFTDTMQHYVNVAREIAHLMTVVDDPPNLDLGVNSAQCHGIMQRGGQYCANKLTWSRASIESFEKFLSGHSNRCYFRNFPRSLYPYGFPRKTLIPADQCLCLGYSPDLETATHLNKRGTIKDNTCRSMIDCRDRHQGTLIHHVAHPIDGTPCDKNNDDMVCWNSKCANSRVSMYGEYMNHISFGRKVSKITIPH